MAKNTVTYNNFIENGCQATFSYPLQTPPYKSKRDRNYWDDWDPKLPRPIHNNSLPSDLIFPSWINFDRHPK